MLGSALTYLASDRQFYLIGPGCGVASNSKFARRGASDRLDQQEARCQLTLAQMADDIRAKVVRDADTDREGVVRPR